MSNTRKSTTEDTPLRQERFMSSRELERGFMGNITARRCEVLSDPKDRELIWFLQLLSHADGGLKAVADQITARWPDRIGTEEMIRLGVKPGRSYGPEQVGAIRRDFLDDGRYLFPLKSDPHFTDLFDESEEDAEARRERDARPTRYDGGKFLDECRYALRYLPEDLERLCLDPAQKLSSGPWYFHALPDVLREYQAAWIAERQAGQVTTEIGNQVNETLDYCLESGRMVVIDGLARTGKTFAAGQWCERHPGLARYVQVPSTNDDIAFFRAIARSLGVSINLNSKAHQLRDRIEDTLQRCRLMIVFDEAAYCWPQGNYREALPGRLNWIMTALVNHGVPVALITTPLFMRAQKRIEQKTYWTGEQFTGRIGHYQRLPDSLSAADLAAVARVQLPEGDETTIDLLIAYAASSAKYLAGIECAVSRARFLAKRDSRSKVSRADIRHAIQEAAIPSDNALAAALADAPGRRQSARPLVSERLPTRGKPLAAPLQPARKAGAESDFSGDRPGSDEPAGMSRLVGTERLSIASLQRATS